MLVKGEIVTKKSRKTGNDYTVLVLTFSNGYQKYVFLDTAETFMLSSLQASENQ